MKMKFSNILCSVILICSTLLSEVESTPITSFLGRYAGEVWGGDMSDKINVMLKEAHKRPHIKKSPLENPNDVIDLMKKRELMIDNKGG